MRWQTAYLVIAVGLLGCVSYLWLTFGERRSIREPISVPLSTAKVLYQTTAPMDTSTPHFPMDMSTTYFPMDMSTTYFPMGALTLSQKRWADSHPCSDKSPFYQWFVRAYKPARKYKYTITALHHAVRPRGMSSVSSSTKEDFSVRDCQTATTGTKLWHECKAHCYLHYYMQEVIRPKNDQVKLDDPDTVDEWWQAAALLAWHLTSPKDYKCNKKKDYGNWRICQDQPYLVKKPCLVYSFGIANDFRFDDAMGRLGCEVHSFDPSMGVKDHKRNKNVAFYNLGISGEDGEKFIPIIDDYARTSTPWEVLTLQSIKKRLGHEKRTLDLLKIDVEGYEWDILHNLLETGMLQQVRQFVLEYHLFEWRLHKDAFKGYLKDIAWLSQLGFKAFQKSPHTAYLFPDLMRLQSEVYYVNTNFTAEP